MRAARGALGKGERGYLMPLSRRTLWIGGALAIVAAVVVLLVVYSGGGGGAPGY